MNVSNVITAVGYSAKDSAPVFHVKDPISALTHFIGCILSVLGTPFLMTRVAMKGIGTVEMLSYGVFALSMAALYGCSAAYHSFTLSTEAGNRRLKKLDHMMIFILIAGSYTPICVAILPRASGIPLLCGVWAFAAAGIAFKAFWVTCPKWISSVIYICMGWLCLFAFPAMFRSMSHPAFGWLFAGGIAYTVGGVIYSLKLPLFTNRHPAFGAHELFHIFVMVGSFCHYMTMLQ